MINYLTLRSRPTLSKELIRLKAIVRNKSRFSYPPGLSAYEEDYLETPIYPKIDPQSNRYTNNQKLIRQNYLDWQTSIQSKETIEEKLIELNINRNHGWRCHMINDDQIHYSAPEFLQYITRTHLMPLEILPEIYDSHELLSKVNHYVDQLKEPFEEVVKFELSGIENKLTCDGVKNLTYSLTSQISRFILQQLTEDEPSIEKFQVDYLPKNDAFWLVGRSVPKEARLHKVKNLEKKKGDQSLIEEQILREDINFQFTGSPLLHLRSEIPLEKFSSSDLNYVSEEPVLKNLNPTEFGPKRSYYYASNDPGYWSPDPSKCSLVSFHSSHFQAVKSLNGLPAELTRMNNESYKKKLPKLIQSQAMLVSFAKLLSQAYALGFDQFSDLDYPLCSQTVISNGMDWSFHFYQLNTIKLDKLHFMTNKNQNICWSSSQMKILNDDGKLNVKVLENLLKVFLVPTLSKCAKPEMPYVKKELESVKDDFRREFVLYNFRQMYSQKRLHQKPFQFPEVYNWESIYKVKHQTMPIEARRRHFEVPSMNPYYDRYAFKDPRYKNKRLKFMEAELAEKKEAERVKAVKEAQLKKFLRVD